MTTDNKSQFSRQTLPTTICCVCGASIVANSVNTCARCLQNRHDITEELEKQILILQCKRCEKYQKEDATFTKADLESKELLAFCLRKVKNLKNLRLIDASFVWTEPHSKRIKVKLKVQKEVERSVILQQSTIIEYVVQMKMCLDCHKSEANLSWDAVVQVRQQVPHKRTFLFLEQLILKHNAQEKAIRIDPMPEGVDFYFSSKSDGARFTSFLDAMVPIRYKQSEKLISADLKSNNSTYNFTFSVEIAPICKDDLVILPKSLAAHLGAISRLCLCLNVSAGIRLIDPLSCRFCEVTSQAYWQNSFKSILDASRLCVFIVLDVILIDDTTTKKKKSKVIFQEEEDDEDEAVDEGEEDQEEEEQVEVQKKRRRKAKMKQGSASARISTKHMLCEVEIAKEKDFGVKDERITIRTHLGYVLKPGDFALGYDIRTANFNYQEDDKKPIEFPEVILVRKHYPRTMKAERSWKLRSIAAEAPDQPGTGVGVKEDDMDLEIFKRDLEEDEEMRDKVNMFKTKTKLVQQKPEGDWPPEVPLENLLDDLHIGGNEEEEMDDEEEDDDESL